MGLEDTSGPTRADFRWDAFLSYHSVDREHVEAVAQKLSEMGLKVWYDQWEIPPGAPFIELLWQGLKSSYATIVFIGPNTVGKWQNEELRAAIAAQVKERRPAIPVFLPGVADPEQVDIEFLSLRNGAVFSAHVGEVRVLNRVYWGITGINPDRPRHTATPASAPAPSPRQVQGVDEAVNNLAGWMKAGGNVTFFVGSAAWAVAPSLPPRDWEIAGRLLRELALVGEGDLLMLPPVDVAATLYAISKTDPVLEETVVRLIQSRSASIPPSHQRLATLLQRLQQRARPRGRRSERQLILTTNIDLMIERALLRANVRFTRVIQHKAGQKLHVTNYHTMASVPHTAEALDEAIASAPQTALMPEDVGPALIEPVLYKVRGSQDLSGSCALTRAQLLAHARAVIAEHLIPAELQKIAANTPIVFLGVGLLDADFQYISNTVLFSAWTSDHAKYLVQVAPDQDAGDGYRRMEVGLWDKIKQFGQLKRSVTTIEERSDRFLERLLDAL